MSMWCRFMPSLPSFLPPSPSHLGSPSFLCSPHAPSRSHLAATLRSVRSFSSTAPPRQSFRRPAPTGTLHALERRASRSFNHPRRAASKRRGPRLRGRHTRSTVHLPVQTPRRNGAPGRGRSVGTRPTREDHHPHRTNRAPTRITDPARSQPHGPALNRGQPAEPPPDRPPREIPQAHAGSVPPPPERNRARPRATEKGARRRARGLRGWARPRPGTRGRKEGAPGRPPQVGQLQPDTRGARKQPQPGPTRINKGPTTHTLQINQPHRHREPPTLEVTLTDHRV